MGVRGQGKVPQTERRACTKVLRQEVPYFTDEDARDQRLASYLI